MASLTIQQVAQYAAQAGFTGYNLITAVAVALAETRGSLDPNAHNTNGEDSRGLWQINVAAGAHPQLASLNLYDPATNAAQAFAISNGGTNWGAWTTYTGGLYKSYWNQATLGIASAGLGNFFGGIFGSATQALGTPAPVTLPNPSQIASQAASTASSAFSGPTNAISQAANNTIGAINNVGTQIATAANNLGSGISQIQAFIAWLDQPNLGTRIAFAVVGFFVLLLGLILFGMSFLPKGSTPTIIPVPV